MVDAGLLLYKVIGGFLMQLYLGGCTEKKTDANLDVYTRLTYNQNATKWGFMHYNSRLHAGGYTGK